MEECLETACSSAYKELKARIKRAIDKNERHHGIFVASIQIQNGLPTILRVNEEQTVLFDKNPKPSS